MKKFPNGKYAKKAYFIIGDSYSKLQQFDNADIWYREILKRWPDLEEMPKESLLSLGLHYFQTGKYNDAVAVLFVHMNLFPDDEQSKSVLYTIGRCFVEMDQLSVAIKMFSRLMEKYPESHEALESMVIMANIGVKKPGIKVPVFMKGIDSYLDPLETYNEMLTKYPGDEMTEGLLHQKGYALWKDGRYKEAFDVYTYLLDQFPDGKYRETSKENLMSVAGLLVDKYYLKGDYIDVSDVYFRVYKEGLIEWDNFKTGFSVGDSLKEIGIYDDAMKVFEKLLKVSWSGKEKARVILAMAGIDYRRGNYDNAEKALRTILRRKPSVVSPEILVYARKMIGDIRYKKGLFDKAAFAYSEVLGSGGDIKGTAGIYRDYAHSLWGMNLYSSAAVNYQRAIKIYNEDDKKVPVDVVVDSYAGLGDCFYKEGKYKQALAMYKQSLDGLPEGEQDMWSLYDVGRGYTKSGNITMAETTFTELREKGGEGFWANVVDYFISDNNWTEKYARYLQIARRD